MRMTNKQKILGAVAVAGVVAAAGSAFTATGLLNSAGASQYIGGTVSQSVSGATLSNIAYDFSDATNTAVSSVTLSLSGAQAKHVSISLAGGTAFTCTDVDAGSSTCSPTTPGDYATGVTGISVTVS
jgi:hypothetical protein